MVIVALYKGVPSVLCFSWHIATKWLPACWLHNNNFN